MIVNLRRSLSFIFLLIPIALLTACGGATPVSPTATLAGATATVPLTEPTAAATPTSTRQTPQAILLVPSGSDPAASDLLKTTLSGLAVAAGLDFQVRTSLSPAELENVRIVVALPPDVGLGSLAAAAPAVQFLAVDIPGIQPAPNLSAITTQPASPDQLGFAAGFVAAAVTEDWRVGVVSEAGTPSGKAAGLGFRNGVTYFCGLCQPAYPPFPIGGFPVLVELPTGAGVEEWQAALETLDTWQIDTAFIDPSLADEAFLAELAIADVHLILGGAPPPPAAAWREHWVASLGNEDYLATISHLWALMMESKGGSEVTAGFGFTGVNPGLISPGRQRLAEGLFSDLADGFIDTGVDPATGESR